MRFVNFAHVGFRLHMKTLLSQHSTAHIFPKAWWYDTTSLRPSLLQCLEQNFLNFLDEETGLFFYYSYFEVKRFPIYHEVISVK